VLDALKIDAPVLIGHSVAGEELSSVATYHPASVAGLVYLDAGSAYALYDKEHGDYVMDLSEIADKLGQLKKSPFDIAQMKALQEMLPRFENNLVQMQNRIVGAEGPSPTPADLASFPAMRLFMADAWGGLPPESELHQIIDETPTGGVGAWRAQPFVAQAIFLGGEKFTELHLPALVIFVEPYEHRRNRTGDPVKFATAEASETTRVEVQIAAFHKSAPQAQIVIIPKQNHYVFISDQAEVLRLISKFIDGLHTALQ
jgi:non-heme chloroperoxidase